MNDHCGHVGPAPIPAQDDSKAGREALRRSGLEVVGEVPWGTHFCQFYATSRDLVETLVPYFRAGLEANEFCIWVTSAPLDVEEARAALGAAVPDLDDRLARGQIEILDHSQWYTASGKFDAAVVLQGWADKLAEARRRGFGGMRLSGNTFWLEDAVWQDFKHYENAVHGVIGGERMLALCTYSLEKCGLREILDIAANHEFALVKQGGRWELIRNVEHQAELSLRESRERLRRFAEITFEGIVISENGRVVDCNEQFADLVGYSPDELKGMSVGAFVVAEDFERIIENIRLGRDCHVEHEVVRKDGTRRFVEVRGKNSPSKPAQRYTAVRDITQRKRAEAAHEESEARFRAMVQAVPSLTFECDAAGLNTFTSESWCAYTGMSFEDSNGRGWTKAVHPEDSEAAVARWAAATQRGTFFESRHRLRAADGSYRWFLARALPTLDAGGNVVRWAGSLTDIDDLVQAQQALQADSRRKDEFLAMLAHELRNPLVPLRNAAHVMARLGLDEPRIKWAQETIEGQVFHLTRLVDELLDVSRIIHGKIELKKEKMAFAELAGKVLEAASLQAESKKHRLAVSLPAEPVWLDADPVRLSQVLLNLLDNAVKYTPDGGEIEFDARLAGREMEIRIRDNGVGIQAELLPHVFDLFQQGGRTLARSQGGLGIGLTLVKRLVGMHGGRVEASNNLPGRGATLTVCLPIVQAPPSPFADEPGSKDRPATGLRVLVVDDDDAVAESTAMLLEMEGYEVRIASSGYAALDEVPAFRPQAVLLDVGLEGMDGFETARRLRKLPEGRGLCLMAVTGYGDEETRAATLSAGCDHHLVKPMHIDRLICLLAEVAEANGRRSDR